jgi:hypothetical protein
MTRSIFRICTILALGFAATHINLQAQERSRLQGVWDVSVTVTDCQTGAPIRIVRSLQMFRHDGTFIETANTASRGISEGIWTPTGGQTYDASYWFFRYKPDGTFASIAKAADMITLGQEAGQFTASGKIEDFDANGALISIGCFTHTAKRLITSEHGDESR